MKIKLITFIAVLILAAGSQAKQPDIIVAKDGTGDFITIQEALNSISISNSNTELKIIIIKKGVYEEKIFIEKSNIVLMGEERDSTIIIFAELRKIWRKDHPSDYGAAVVNIKNNVADVSLISLSIYNNYGSLYGDNDHQFAIRGGEGVTRIILDNCKVIADGGDTVSLWNTEDGMYYHRDCHFEGYVDYVCPRGYCYIENSQFFGHSLTASIWHDGRKKDHKFVIKNSRFNGVPNFPLGRHHRDAQFFLIGCSFSSNMADREIYFTPSDPPRNLQWGTGRSYFYGCSGDSINYAWHADNLHEAPGAPEASDITALWTFNNNWDPEKFLSDFYQRLR